MLLLLPVGVAFATSYARVPTPEDALEGSSVIVHGFVSEVAPCLGTRAWTFVTVDMVDIIRGELFDSTCKKTLGGGNEMMSTSSFTSSAEEACWTEADVTMVEEATEDLDDGEPPAEPWVMTYGESTCVDEDWQLSQAWSEVEKYGWGLGAESLGDEALMSLTSTPFTFRLPYGPYPDGTVGTIIDTPGFVVGEEVYLFLQYDADGSYRFMPLGDMGWSVYRVFRSGTTSAVVNGFGQPLFVTSTTGPRTGRAAKPLRSLYYTDPPLNGAAVTNTLNGIRQSSTWNGTSFAGGPWQGDVTVKVTGDAAGTCTARLVGNATPTSISVSGRCNADYAGATTVSLSGTRTNGVWSGTLTLTPTALPNQSRNVPWTSNFAANDLFRASGNGHITESGYDFDWTLALRMGYAGNRPLVTAGAFDLWLHNRARADAASAGIACDIVLSTGTCDDTVPLTVVEE